MPQQANELWKQFLSDQGPVLLYTADPGAYAMGKVISRFLEEMGSLSGWYAEGWCLRQRPDLLPSIKLAAQFRPGMTLLLGSQVTYDRTHHFTRLAKEAGARCIFVFDNWKNYGEHFHADFLPDTIVVPDEVGRLAVLSTVGQQNASRLQVLPHLGILAAVERILSFPQRSPGTIAVLLDPTEPEDALGYDWRSVLQHVNELVTGTGIQVVAIKPHPRQNTFVVSAFLAEMGPSQAKFSVVSTDTEELIAAADEVWGMTTIALVAALKAGKPIKSIQTGRNDRGIAASNHYLEPYLVRTK